MDCIENRTFDEIALGDTASLARTLSKEDIQLFAVMSGDVNPAHVDEEYARSDMFHKIIAHGMWGASLISTLLGTRLPGPGTIYLGQTLRFLRPVALGDAITVSVTATSKDPEKKRVTFHCECVNQMGQVVISGEAEVIAPAEKVRRPRVILPEVELHDHGAVFRRLIDLAGALPPLCTAIVHPVERAALRSAITAAQAHLIVPVLVGPETRIRAAAAAEDLDLAPYTLIGTEHSHEAAARAVALARAGEVGAILQSNPRVDELTQAVVAPHSGLATDRCLSHVYVLDVPTYPRPLFLTDAVLNAYPDLEAKRAIVQNAIDLARATGLAAPRVAILSAVETVNPQIRSSLDAAALCKMVDRGQIRGGVVDGPFTFDSAVSPEVARAGGLASPVAGQADILVAPDLESGTMLAKQLESLAEAQAAGLVVGARVPIVLAGLDSATPLAYLAACALAVMLAHVWQRATLSPP